MTAARLTAGVDLHVYSVTIDLDTRRPIAAAGNRVATVTPP